MNKNEYAEKLKDPRWQKKRLEILNRDEFACKWCLDDESTLHVHHLWYTPGDPWEAPDKSLLTLCEACHEEESKQRKAEEDHLLQVLRETRLNATSITDLSLAVQESGIYDEIDWSIMMWGMVNKEAKKIIRDLWHEKHHSYADFKNE